MTKETALLLASMLLKVANEIIKAFQLSDDELKEHVSKRLDAESEVAGDLAEYEATKDLKSLIDD